MLEIFKERPMIVLISILWGLGLATLFTAVANRRNCIIIRGESPYEIEQKVFQYPDLDNKCYQFKGTMSKCDLEIPNKIKINSNKDTDLKRIHSYKVK